MSSNQHRVLTTALGELTAVRDGATVVGVYFPHHWHRPSAATLGRSTGDGFAHLAEQLEQYLAGARPAFDLELRADGDKVQQQIWTLITEIPYGATTTYGELARRLARPGITAQHVGAAVARNPLSILIPCHRVVGAGEKLVGYAGGLIRKQQLLDLERAHCDRPGQLALAW